MIIKISKQNKAIFGMQVREKTNVKGEIGERHRSVQVVRVANVFLCGVKNKQYEDKVSTFSGKFAAFLVIPDGRIDNRAYQLHGFTNDKGTFCNKTKRTDLHFFEKNLKSVLSTVM